MEWAALGPSRRIAAAASVAAMLVASSARSQDEAAIAAARALGQDGAVAAQNGRCEEAVDKLARAKRIIAAPTILVPLGECQIALGKIVVGTENLQTVARERLAADAPRAFVDAQNRARQLLPDALKKLARLAVVVAAPAGTKIDVSDNGEPIGDVLVGVERPADPGKHVVVATAPGFLKATAEVTLASGQRETVKLELRRDPNAAIVPVEPKKPVDAKPAAPAPVPPEPERTSSPLVTAGVVALGLGGAGLVAGAVFGALASGKKSDLDEVCVDKLCPDASSSEIDDMRLFGNVSTISFVAGGLGVGLGATLLGIGLASRSDDGERAAVAPLVGPRFAGIRARF